MLLAAYSESYRIDTANGGHTHAFVDEKNDDDDDEEDDDDADEDADAEEWQHLHSISSQLSLNHSNASPMAVSSAVLFEHTLAPR